MSKITAAITAVGGYVPDFVLSNKVLETMVDTNDEWITSRTGIKERRILKGEGLGTDKDGIVNPIDVKLRPKQMGLGHNHFDERTESVKKEQKTVDSAPVEKEQSSVHNHATMAAISSGVPKRPMGILLNMNCMCSGVSWSKMGVLTAAGVTQFTRTPVSANSLPSDLVNAITAALLAL
jgi:hypothetical protein